MRVAIVHEWLTSVGGSDKVVKAIAEVFPKAEIFTLVSDKSVCEELGFDYSKIHNSFIQHLPFGVSKYRSYLPLMPFAIEQFDLSGFDIVISSSHAVAKGVITRSDQLHICYCHSPIRYAWDMYHRYLKDAKLDKGFKGLLAKYFLHRVRLWDVLSSQRVDEFISNSDYIGKRIMKIYRREAKTIYPNVDITSFKLCEAKDDFYLASSRFVPYKKLDVIVNAFNLMPDKELVVIGSGPDLKKIKSIAGTNVKILGYQPFDVLKDYMQRAKAFVFAADEDFGIIPVEAQACGTPVIAFGHGGAKETVVEGETGIFFNEQTPEAICNAVNEFEQGKYSFNPEVIRKNAERFSEERFKREFSEFVLRKYHDLKSGS